MWFVEWNIQYSTGQTRDLIRMDIPLNVSLIPGIIVLQRVRQITRVFLPHDFQEVHNRVQRAESYSNIDGNCLCLSDIMDALFRRSSYPSILCRYSQMDFRLVCALSPLIP